MILDTVIETGNPADSSRLIPMIKRLDEVYGKLPNQVADDTGYASRENIDDDLSISTKGNSLQFQIY